MVENVKRGAVLLDKGMPGWHRIVNDRMITGRFHMTDWESCIAGSLEIAELDELDKPYITLNGTTLVGYEQAHDFGFTTNGITSFIVLEQLWRDEIEARLLTDEWAAQSEEDHQYDADEREYEDLTVHS